MPEQLKPPVLAEMSWTEARDLLRLRPVGFLPVGAIEAHGPHLPLNTDIIIAEAMATRAAALLHGAGVPTAILPSVSYSVSYVGACFPGTTPVDAETLSDYLFHILVRSAAQGYRLICVCNAHLEPAHVDAVAAAASSAGKESPVPIVFPDKRSEHWSRRLGDEFQRGSRHAGWYETSIVLAARPEVVRRQWLEELPPNWVDLPAALRGGARDFIEAGADLGYFGDPASATAEDGERLITTLGELFRDHVLDMLARER